MEIKVPFPMGMKESISHVFNLSWQLASSVRIKNGSCFVALPNKHNDLLRW